LARPLHYCSPHLKINYLPDTSQSAQLINMRHSRSIPLNVRLAEFAICLTVGCLMAQRDSIGLGQLKLGLILITGLALSLYATRNHVRPNRHFAPLAWVFMIWFGVANYQSHRPISVAQGQSIIRAINGEPFYAITLTRQLSSPEGQQYFLGSIQHESQKYQTHILVRYTPKVLEKSLSSDQVIWTNTPLEMIPGPKNPGGFNYAALQYYRGMILQTKISDKTQILYQSQTPPSLSGVAQNINKHLSKRLDHPLIAPKHQAIIKAILLGDKSELTPEIKQQFAASGAMHILALSGLHVGVATWLLMLLTWPLRRLVWGRQLSTIIVLVVLWHYALVSGLSPSMVRAVTMMSIWSIGQLMQRPIGAINALLLTYVILLIAKPLWLFEVGFQLSFLAVLSILIVTPKLSLLGRPKNKILAYLWSITRLSLAAQLGVAPIAAYYFHQFPGLFWLSNIFLLPMLTPILIMGGIIISGQQWVNLPHALYAFFDALLGVADRILGWIAAQEQFIMTELYLHWTHLVGIYFGMIIWLMCKTRSIQSVALIGLKTITATLLLTSLFGQNSIGQMTLLHLPGQTLLVLHTEQGLVHFSSRWPLSENAKKVQKELEHAYQIKSLSTQSLEAVLYYNDVPIVVIDQFGQYPMAQGAIVILTQNSPIHLEQLINDLAPRLILADASNFKNRVHLWRQYCRQKGVDFMDTYAFGAIKQWTQSPKTFL